ncbi:MAG: PGF-pre-PGF domain-containing protein [Nanoarchaeota archaeon]
MRLRKKEGGQTKLGDVWKKSFNYILVFIIILVLIALLYFGLKFGITGAATINASNCSYSAVESAVNAAADNDTVVIPACPSGVNWTTTLTITKGITLQGQGIGQTVLIDGVSKGDSNCAGAGSILTFNVNSPKTFRLTGLTIRGSAPDAFGCNKGHLIIQGTSKSFRIDHVRFENQQTGGIRAYDDLWGVIDHNEFQGTHDQGVIVLHNTWGGVPYGDGSWADDSYFGTEKFIFIEDNTFTDPTPSGACALDAFGGSRVVFRYNTAGCMVNHGTESSQRFRGSRVMEIYKNNFTATPGGLTNCMFNRGGTAVFWGNNCNQNGSDSYGNSFPMINYRDTDTFSPFGSCDSSGAFDVNDATVYVSGTHNGANATSGVLTDTTKNFNTACSGGSCAGNEFSIRNTAKNWGSSISSVTTTTVTNTASVYGQGRVWDNGDTYQIRKAYPCLDQVGRGKGNLISGDTPLPAAWPNQTLEPVYQWNNTLNGVTNPVAAAAYNIHPKENRDFYNNVAMPGYTSYTYPHPLVSGAADTTAPVRSNGQPTGNLTAGTTSTAVNLTTDETATCKYSTTSGVAYSSMTNTFSTTGSTSHSTTVSGLTNGSTYNYYVRCNDTSGNFNTNDFTISFSVSAPDTTAPVRSNGQPTGNLTAGTTSTAVNLTTDETATCKYSTTSGVAYSSMTNTFSTTGSTSHSTTVSGLTNGSTYNYYVRCNDTSGNFNTNDFTISFSVNVTTDSIAPTVTLRSPENASTWSSSSTVVFTYNVSDASSITNCSLLIDNSVDQTDTTITKDSNQTFSKTLTNADHNWSVSCYDSSNNSGSSATRYLTVSVTATSAAAATGGGGGGGGGGEASVTQTITQETHPQLNIAPDAPAIIRDFDPELGIKQAHIEVNNEALDVKVTVSKYDEKPAEVTVSKTGRVYRYLQIETENLNEKLNKAIITIQVERLWAAENGLEKESIAVFKFDPDYEVWNELVTTFDDEDDSYYYYDVELDSFSYFAISEKTIAEIAGEERDLTWLWIFIGVVVWVLAAVILIIFLRKRAENRRYIGSYSS